MTIIMAVRELPALSDRAPAAQLNSFDATSLAAVVGGELLLSGPAPIRGAAVDSRRIEAGNIFFALPGERTDGHRFVLDAVRAGASALVVSESLAPSELAALGAAAGGGDGLTIVRVADGLAALQAAAAAWRSRFAPLCVGVTGSLAKTSTKEQIAEVLGQRWTVLRNRANENNEIGLPLTLLRMGSEHGAAVLEMGMYQPGDIALLGRMARPTIGVVTAVRNTHLERAGSIEAIERGKRELIDALPAGGTAVLNGDDPRVADMAATRADLNVIRYGFGPTADVSSRDVESRGAAGMRFVLAARGEEIEVISPALGRHSVHNALAAAAVGLAAGLGIADIAAGLARPFSVPHRTTLLSVGEWQILDDSYNAAPDSMRAALDLLASLPGRRIAVLGEMRELGAQSDAAHRDIGGHAARTAQMLVAVGPMAHLYGAGALSGGMHRAAVIEAADRTAALSELKRQLRSGDVVLIKASRGAELDLLVDDLLRLADAGGAQ